MLPGAMRVNLSAACAQTPIENAASRRWPTRAILLVLNNASLVKVKDSVRHLRHPRQVPTVRDPLSPTLQIISAAMVPST
jgi:hypothetical protein